MNPPFTVDALHFNIKTTYVIIVINIKNNGLKSIYYDVYTVYYVNIMKKNIWHHYDKTYRLSTHCF